MPYYQIFTATAVPANKKAGHSASFSVSEYLSVNDGGDVQHVHPAV